jgi:hypothetical protein
VSRVSNQKCREYILGNDPMTGKPVVAEIVEALTKPLSREAKRAGLIERPEPRLIGPGTEENLQQLFLENKWTDFLPIVLPTKERVARMLKGTSHKPDEIVGELRAGYEAGRYNVETVAANAVMAGAKPEYMPVILAMAASGVPAIATSTQSFARMLVINGPIRREINMNAGCGALSPFNQANAVIGRTATLMSMNLGRGGVPNLTFWGTQGNNLNYNHVTFASLLSSMVMAFGTGRTLLKKSTTKGFSTWRIGSCLPVDIRADIACFSTPSWPKDSLKKVSLQKNH